MMMQKEKTVGKAKTVGTLFSGNDLKKLIFPLIIEQILAVSVGMVDTMMVSSAGEAATSGVSLVDIINVLIINIFAAVATGGAVVASQYLGQKRKDRAGQSADQLICAFTSKASAMVQIFLHSEIPPQLQASG